MVSMGWEEVSLQGVERPALSKELLVSESIIGSESSSWSRNKPKLLSWVLNFGHKGGDGACEGSQGANSFSGQDTFKGSISLGFSRASVGGNGLGGSGRKSL